MFLVTKVFGNDYSEDPDAFVMEFETAEVGYIARKCRAVSRLKGATSVKYYDANGRWIDSVKIAELLEEHEVIFLKELPDDCVDHDGVRGNSVSIYPDGDLIFKAYQKYANWDYLTPSVNISKLREALKTTPPIGEPC